MTRQDARKVVKRLLQGKILVVSVPRREGGRGRDEVRKGKQGEGGEGKEEEGRVRDRGRAGEQRERGEGKPCEQGGGKVAAGQGAVGECLRGTRGKGRKEAL